jgi:23S rRNA pseudouridine2604 synthase
MTDTVRLATHLATLIGCSRREAEQYIEGGGVRVDGAVVDEPGYRVRPAQTVALAPGARCEPVPPVTLLLNKPAGISTNPPADDTPHPLMALLTPANRLQEDREMRWLSKHGKGQVLLTPLETGATGLVVVSQDHRIVRKLQTEAGKLEQEYVIETESEIDDEALEKLNLDVTPKGRKRPSAKVSRQSENRLRFALKSPEKGQIAQMCDDAGVVIVGMRRTRIGRLPLAPLTPGQWRFLRGYERF